VDDSRTQVLYRFYDRAGELLYVGITANMPGRLAAHRGDKSWFVEVDKIRLEHHVSREAVLSAEREAIIRERPKYNVVHNSGNPSRSKSVVVPPTEYGPWTFSSLKSGYRRTTHLRLFWELNGDPVSDNYYIEDISARELWREWMMRHPRDEGCEDVYGPGTRRIHWYVEGLATFESAPFQDRHWDWWREHQFTNWYTHPYSEVTGERLQWSRLPVVDKGWRKPMPSEFESKGGFIQEVTGWKPSPLQPFVNINDLADAAGVYRNRP
jgi:predicted GIY-YIG superfamily endonuclease